MPTFTDLNFSAFNVVSNELTIENKKSVDSGFLNINLATDKSIDKMIAIKPEVQAIFNKNEALYEKEMTTITPDKFGVLGHLDPTRNLLFDAIHAIGKLRHQFVSEEDGILMKAETLFSDVKDRNIKEGLQIDEKVFESQYWSVFNKTGAAISTIDYEYKINEGGTDKIVKKTTSIKGISDLLELDVNSDKVSSLYSTGLFHAGNTVRSEIKDIDRLHNLLVDLQTKLARALARKNNELIKLDAEIPVQQRNLASLNQERIKALGEYSMVMALVEENWLSVEKEYVKREQILTNHQGIYFARVNETPYGKVSLTDIELRFGRLEDLVPGTAISHEELPDDIEPYIEAVVDIPIANWKKFNAQWNLLPSRNTILKLLNQRKLRMGFSAQQKRTASSAKFLNLLQVHQSLIQDYARIELIASPSLQTFYQQAVNILSLEDLLSGTPHQLRGTVQEFRNQLDQATHLLLDRLHNIKPGIRLEWATAAELDELDLKNPESWPGFSVVEEQDVNNIRTLVELIHWWWRQLNDDVNSNAITAVRNLLRAALMVAVGDDPKEMIHGQLQFIPNIFKAGDLLRASLNRHAAIGTQLNLLNAQNEIIGILKVEDTDDKGAVVSIAQLYKEEANTPQSQYTLVGAKTSARSFV